MQGPHRTLRLVCIARLVLVLGSIVGIVGCTAEVEPTKPPAAVRHSAGSLVIEPATCDFGAIQQMDVRTFTFLATNTGTETLRLLAFDGT